MRHILLTTIILCHAAFTAVAQNYSYELPAPLTKVPEQIVKHTGYTLSYNRSRNTPNWSAWRLTAKHTDGPVDRLTKFFADPAIPQAYRVDYYDYKGSGYDRGHMCPAGDMKWSYNAMHDCFYMSNMCPQEPRLNSGAWKQLEEACRQWALTEGTIYIVCGPIYTKGKRPETIGIDHSVSVPDAFFKAVLSLRRGHQKAIAFVYRNDASKQPMSKTAMSVDALERLIGMDLFHNLNDTLEAKLESTYDLKLWK